MQSTISERWASATAMPPRPSRSVSTMVRHCSPRSMRHRGNRSHWQWQCQSAAPSPPHPPPHTHTHTRAPPMKPKVGGWQQIAIAISVDCSSCCAIVTGSEIRHATAIYSAGGNNLMWANGCRQRRSLFIPAGTYMISTPLIVHSNQNHSELVGGKDHHWHSLLLACQDSNVASVK